MQVYQGIYINSNRIPHPTYKIRNKIWLNARNIILIHLIKKFDAKYYGLFEVNKILDSYSYRFKFLYKLEKIYNIFHSSFLYIANQLFLPGQIDLLFLLIIIDKNKKKV
jgi:hypothetical protein